MGETDYAFPFQPRHRDGTPMCAPEPGMTLRDYFAGQALANKGICTGTEPDWQLGVWFGKHATGITREQIASRQAYAYADAMLKARAALGEDR